MDETKRFLRYVLPGVIFLLELAGFLWLADSARLAPVLDYFRKGDDSGLKILAAAVAAIGSSGAMGYLLSITYHALIWWETPNFRLAIDYRELVNTFSTRGLVDLRDFRDQVRCASDLTPAQAWVLVTALWHERSEESPKIKGSMRRAESLADLYHTAGTVAFGTALAFVIPLFCGLCSETRAPAGLFWLLVIGFLLILVQLISFTKARQMHHDYTGVVLLRELSKDAPRVILPDEPARTPTAVHFPFDV